MSNQRLSVDEQRIWRELEQLAQISSADPPAVTRVMLSDEDLQARSYLTDLFREAGLVVRNDAAGNILARWPGSNPDLPAVATGSHIDAIPHSGRFDGTVGVLGGLEAFRALKRLGFQPTRSLELIVFTSEEPTRYGIGCLGSRLLSGALASYSADQLTDEHGFTFAELREAAGLKGDLSDTSLQSNHFHAFLELHIEQGPLLEEAKLPIGIVESIAAPAALRVTFEGEGGHAGAVLMPDRRDALLPACELALGVRSAATTLGGQDTVATTGVLNVYPDAINSIPSRTTMEIDVRDIELLRRDKVLAKIKEQAELLGENYRCTTTTEVLNADPPASCDDNCIAAIAEACNESGLAYQKMISRAYHDTLFMALICPVAMIFIPCRNGVSHRPDEYSSPAAIAAGTEVLARSLMRLAE